MENNDTPYHEVTLGVASMVEKRFLMEVMNISIPVALQSMLQSSFSMIDQVMVGQLGDQSVAAVEIASKPGFIYAFLISAISTITAIMTSQYIGKNNREAEEKTLCINLLVMFIVGSCFLLAFSIFRNSFISLFSNDHPVEQRGIEYLQVIVLTFIPLGICNILSVPLRCHNHSMWPLYIGIFTALVNTFFNFCLIFGHFGAPSLGVQGAAIASVISQMVGAFLTLVCIYKLYGRINISLRLDQKGYQQYFKMLLPIAFSECLWAVGQSVNTYVYGHMGTNELAGMSLTGAIQGLTIGALSGLAQAAGILIGKRLGRNEYDEAYSESIRICEFGFIGSVVLSLMIVLLRSSYVGVFQVSPSAKSIGEKILLVFAFLMPAKVLNMILGGGVIRSGGKTKYIMMIDILGTWFIGVPLAVFTGLFLKLSIVWVYLILSQEEMVRLLLTAYMFRSRKWMNTIS